MKKVSIVLSSVIIFVLALFSLSLPMAVVGQDATATPLPTITSVPPIAQPPGTVKVSFWYGLGGLLGNVVQETVNMYNSSQSKYYIEAIFQSSYDDTINKINAGLASGDLPNVVQIFEAGTQRMIDTGKIIPVQQLLERDGLTNVIDDLEPAVRGNYTVNGTLYSMPFNSSTAMLYFDAKAFRDAGIDVSKRIWTYEEVLAAAEKLTVKDASGKTTRYGMALYAESWFFEQAHAAHEAVFGTPANGRGAERMSAYTFNGEVGVGFMDFMKAAVDSGSAQWLGPGGGGAAGAAYANGEAAMVFSSIASLRTLIATSERSGKGVEVDVMMMPRTNVEAGRTIVGGASLWITNTGSQEQQDGAWDFMKWAVQPEIQAFWSANTGYYPVVQASYDQQVMQDALVKYPQFQVALDSIRSAPNSDSNSAHISGVFVSMRQDIVAAQDEYITGKVATAQESLDNAVAAANEKLEEYNSTVP